MAAGPATWSNVSSISRAGAGVSRVTTTANRVAAAKPGVAGFMFQTPTSLKYETVALNPNRSANPLAPS